METNNQPMYLLPRPKKQLAEVNKQLTRGVGEASKKVSTAAATTASN